MVLALFSSSFPCCLSVYVYSTYLYLYRDLCVILYLLQNSESNWFPIASDLTSDDDWDVDSVPGHQPDEEWVVDSGMDSDDARETDSDQEPWSPILVPASPVRAPRPAPLGPVVTIPATPPSRNVRVAPPVRDDISMGYPLTRMVPDVLQHLVLFRTHLAVRADEIALRWDYLPLSVTGGHFSPALTREVRLQAPLATSPPQEQWQQLQEQMRQLQRWSAALDAFNNRTSELEALWASANMDASFVSWLHHPDDADLREARFEVRRLRNVVNSLSALPNINTEIHNYAHNGDFP